MTYREQADVIVRTCRFRWWRRVHGKVRGRRRLLSQPLYVDPDWVAAVLRDGSSWRQASQGGSFEVVPTRENVEEMRRRCRDPQYTASRSKSYNMPPSVFASFVDLVFREWLRKGQPLPKT